MKKFKWAFILTISLVVAVLLGYFIYKKVAESKKIEVKFIDSYNNEVLSIEELEVGQDATVPEEPKHEGCKFTGWFTNDGKEIKAFTKLENDLTVYAKCENIYFSVKFYDTIAKKVIDTQKIKYGESAIEPDAPEHYGYNFVRWKGSYSNVKSNVTINTVYAAQRAKYVVKYYTLDESNKESLYTSKTFNSYVNRKVKASIISIGGYKYYSDYSSNKLSGRVDEDNSLILKVYYHSRKYSVTINDETNEYDYKDKVTLPLLQKSATLTYQENEKVANKLEPNKVDLTLLGYCKNEITCEVEEMIKPETVISVTEDATYYPVWNMDMELLLPVGENYEDEGITYSFVNWIGPESEYNEGDSFTFIEDVTLIATYKQGNNESTDKAKYSIVTYYNDEMHSKISEEGEIGSQVFGTDYAVEVEGYTINSYTEYIFLSEDNDKNVIEIYYVSTSTDESGEGESDTPSETPESAPLDEPGEGESGTPSETPESAPLDEPSEGESDTPNETPESAPANESGEGESGTPSETPESAPLDEPSEGESGTPNETPESAPLDEPGEGESDTPNETPESAPANESGEDESGTPSVDAGNSNIGSQVTDTPSSNDTNSESINESNQEGN